MSPLHPPPTHLFLPHFHLWTASIVAMETDLVWKNAAMYDPVCIQVGRILGRLPPPSLTSPTTSIFPLWKWHLFTSKTSITHSSLSKVEEARRHCTLKYFRSILCRFSRDADIFFWQKIYKTKKKFTMTTNKQTNKRCILVISVKFCSSLSRTMMYCDNHHCCVQCQLKNIVRESTSLGKKIIFCVNELNNFCGFHALWGISPCGCVGVLQVIQSSLQKHLSQANIQSVPLTMAIWILASVAFPTWSHSAVTTCLTLVTKT